MKKRIVWITPECYLDVDLPIIAELTKKYIIYWQIILDYNHLIDYNKFVLNKLRNCTNVTITFERQKYRLRDLRNISFYISIIRKAKSFNPNLYYISFYAQPYGLLLYKLLLPLRKCIVACHNVTTPEGASGGRFVKYYTHYWLKTFENIQVFSKGQQVVLESMHKNKKILMAPLAIKDYGDARKICNKQVLPFVRFLFFGNILNYKRVDLLIEAAHILHNRGINGFKIRIAGNCKEWGDNYANLIKRSEYFELIIKRIPNEDVADLFADSHYFVMPYQDIAQSGAITVAFRYNLPVIASDIPQFKEFVTDGKDGIFFRSKNAEDLANKMEYVLKNHETQYSQLCKNQHNFVKNNLSLSSIVKRYCDYIEQL